MCSSVVGMLMIVQVGYNKLSQLHQLAASSNDPHGVDFVGNMARAQV